MIVMIGVVGVVGGMGVVGIINKEPGTSNQQPFSVNVEM
jgi:hypothetical protein